MRRLLPDPGDTGVAAQLEGYRPWEGALPGERPHTAVNFAATLDGRVTIDGRSGPIGSKTDTEMLQRLRTRFDAVMVAAGTLRTERYGRIVSDPALRTEREQAGLSPDPLAVIVSNSFDLPWDAPIFTDGGGEILVFTSAEAEAPETATPVQVVRHDGQVDLAAAMSTLRAERGVRSLLCEGGPSLFATLVSASLVDELFLTIAAKISGEGPALVEGGLVDVLAFELTWLLEDDGELFARYAVTRAAAR